MSSSKTLFSMLATALVGLSALAPSQSLAANPQCLIAMGGEKAIFADRLTNSAGPVRQGIYAMMRAFLGKRYDIEVIGLEEVAKKGDKGIVFLFEHPALVDPAIFYSVAGPTFSPRPIVAESQNKGPVSWLIKKVGAGIVPEAGDKEVRAQKIEQLNAQILSTLSQGDNWAIAPAGQIKRTRLDQIRGRSMAAHVIKNLPPGARVVIVTSKGLLGSSFSFGQTGNKPSGPELSGDLVYGLLTGGLQKRNVKLTFDEISPAELAQMRSLERDGINEILEARINAVEAENVYVPLLKCQPTCKLPEPIPETNKSKQEAQAIAEASKEIPAATKNALIAAMKEALPEKADAIDKLFSEKSVEDDTVASRLDLDSLAFLEVTLEVEKKLGIRFEELGEPTPDDLLVAVHKALVAGGKAEKAAPKKRIDLRYFRYSQSGLVTQIPTGDTILEVLYKKAQQIPDNAWMGDERAGVMTYRQAVSKIVLIARMFSRMEGENVGIMLPPSVGASLMFFGSMQAGKVPALLNYTSGNEVLKSMADSANLKVIVTSKEFVQLIKEKGYNTDSIKDRLIYTEDLLAQAQDRSRANLPNLLANLITREKARFRSLWPNGRGNGSHTAAILFTSGSSSMPKPVALSHKNILTNARDVAAIFNLTSNDSVMGYIPLFHSLGLTGTTVMPAISGVRVYHFPNTTDGRGIAQAIGDSKATFVIGPPDLMSQVFKSSSDGQLDSLRFVVTGAAPLRPEMAQFLASKAKNATILEGAGTTEASPVWAINPPWDVRPGFVGKIINSVQFIVADHDSVNAAVSGKNSSLIRTAEKDENGLFDGELLIAGDSVITSYLGNMKPEAFIVIDGTKYFRTEDRVKVTSDRWAKIVGRFNREHKTNGGEKISHDTIEAQLESMPELRRGEDGKPTMFVGVGRLANGDPVTTLVSTRELTPDQVNAHLKGKLGPSWYIARVIRVPEIPLLGTGKIDGKTVKELINQAFATGK